LDRSWPKTVYIKKIGGIPPGCGLRTIGANGKKTITSRRALLAGAAALATGTTANAAVKPMASAECTYPDHARKLVAVTIDR
jgi:hypothetical protein